jgi:hypothetical protein
MKMMSPERLKKFTTTTPPAAPDPLLLAIEKLRETNAIGYNALLAVLQKLVEAPATAPRVEVTVPMGGVIEAIQAIPQPLVVVQPGEPAPVYRPSKVRTNIVKSADGVRILYAEHEVLEWQRVPEVQPTTGE